MLKEEKKSQSRILYQPNNKTVKNEGDSPHKWTDVESMLIAVYNSCNCQL